MVAVRGKKHEFVCMDIIFTDESTVKMLMIDYIKEYVISFGETINKKHYHLHRVVYLL